MIDGELNPEHPMTQAVHDHWHKLCAALMLKFGSNRVVLTMADLKKLEHGSAIVIRELSDGLHLDLVPEAEAIRIEREERKRHGAPTG